MQDPGKEGIEDAAAAGRKGPFRLGPWTVWPDRLLIRSTEAEHRLEPKVMAVLDYLASHALEVISKDQLVDQVWNRAFVSDEVIARCISVLRQRLGDDHRQPTFIETIPKTGYRLLVSPTAVEQDGKPASAPGPTFKIPLVYRHNRSNAALAGVSVIVVLTLALMFEGLLNRPYRAADEGQVSLAVLPFANVGGDPDNEYFSDGLSEEILNALARREELRVVSRTSSFALKGAREDVRDIGQRLGVRYLLEGSVRRSAQKLRISAQLIDTDTGLDIWSENYSGNLADTFAVQNDVSVAIVRELLPRLSRKERPQGKLSPEETLEYPVYDKYLQALFHLNRRSQEHLERAIGLLKSVVDSDPGFGPAYQQLASAYVLMPSYSSRGREEMFTLALEALQEGEKQSSSVPPGADTVRGYIAFKSWNWQAANDYFTRAAEASPNDANLFQWRSQFQASTGRLQESLQDALKAKSLDTLSPVVNDRLAIAYLWLNRDQEAAEAFYRAGELGLATGVHAESQLLVLARQGLFEQAAQAAIGLQTMLGMDSAWVVPVMAGLQDPSEAGEARLALAEAADRSQVSANVLLVAWAMLGDADRAIEQAFKLAATPTEMEVEMLFVDELDILRQHPRFPELLEQIGLLSYWDATAWPTMCRRQNEKIACT
jgi:TolB-like protein/DNA-binding winged helix-turn-helix (wHTH) protein